MKLLTLLSFVCLFQIQNCRAMYDERVEDAPKLAHKIASKFPHQVGCLFSETSEMGSCVFLDETTALTSLHTQMLHNKKEKQVVISADSFDIVFNKDNNNINFLETIKCLPAKTWSFYDIHLLGKLEEIPVITNFKAEDVFKNVDNQINSLPELILPMKEMMVGEKKYKLIGSDLAVLKLKTSLNLTKKPIKFEAFDPEAITKWPAYSLGFMKGIAFSNGIFSLYSNSLKRTITCKNSIISCPTLNFFNDTNVFYGTYLSPGASDEKFSCKNLSQPETEDQKIYGRISGGLSGGPLFFKNEDGSYTLGGIVSQTYASQLIFALTFITTNNSENKKIKKKAQKLLNKYEKYEFPTYDVYQSFSKEDLSKIDELMKPNDALVKQGDKK